MKLPLIASLFALALLLLQTASQAYTSPGWVYAYGSFNQNGYFSQVYLSVSDKGTSMSGGLTLTNYTTTVRAYPNTVSYIMSGSLCTGATLTGPGNYTCAGVTSTGQMTLHVWKGVVNGVGGTWMQAELWSNDPIPSLLWATGPTWPASASSPVKVGGSIFQLPVR